MGKPKVILSIVRINAVVDEVLLKVAVINGGFSGTFLQGRFGQGVCRLGLGPGSGLV
jgi:hypothetical protein